MFGPVLHLIHYSADRLDDVLAAVNATGYGLTFGVHSRIDEKIATSRAHAVGNVYVNRNMIGAVVGVQPFGGEGLSGTGPKAGGPHYLPASRPSARSPQHHGRRRQRQPAQPEPGKRGLIGMILTKSGHNTQYIP